MPDYSKAKIYKLINEQTNECYYGSTICKLSTRLSGHKLSSNECVSKKLFETGSVIIILVENYPCSSREELLSRERYWIDNNSCINKVRPTISEEERLEYIHTYISEHKDKINERDCNYRSNNREYYKERAKAQRERNPNYTKDYIAKRKLEDPDYYTRKQRERRDKLKAI